MQRLIRNMLDEESCSPLNALRCLAHTSLCNLSESKQETALTETCGPNIQMQVNSPCNEHYNLDKIAGSVSRGMMHPSCKMQ